MHQLLKFCSQLYNHTAELPPFGVVTMFLAGRSRFDSRQTQGIFSSLTLADRFWDLVLFSGYPVLFSLAQACWSGKLIIYFYPVRRSRMSASTPSYICMACMGTALLQNRKYFTDEMFCYRFPLPSSSPGTTHFLCFPI
jgi:hypothetical protein